MKTRKIEFIDLKQGQHCSYQGKLFIKDTDDCATNIRTGAICEIDNHDEVTPVKLIIRRK